MSLSQILQKAHSREASDVYFKAGIPPVLRISKDLISLEEYGPLSKEKIEEFIKEIIGEDRYTTFCEKKELDVAYLSPDIARFRVNIFFQRGYPGMVMRRIRQNIESFETLNLPQILEKICYFESGIVLVCGPARSGKSTTIASMIEYINTHRRVHIITLEDPIEYLFEDKQSIIEQREIGLDSSSFANALKHVMRQDPDIIFIGELRDRDSFHTAITAAETGHLIISSLHAHDAKTAVERILDYYPLSQREQIRAQLSANTSAIITLMLISRKNADGVVPAAEVLIGNSVVKKLIKENRLDKLQAAIELGQNEGMQTFNKSLINLMKKGLISEEDAIARSPNPEILKLNLKGIFLDDSRKILDTSV